VNLLGAGDALAFQVQMERFQGNSFVCGDYGVLFLSPLVCSVFYITHISSFGI
jgi:hypothetical protein